MNLIDKYLGKVDEVMGYKLKPKDKKVIQAFIDGYKDGKGNALWIEGDYLFGPMMSSTSDYVAKRDKDGKIHVGRAYGNVSQTYQNFIKKNTPKNWLA
jgi:hypothetical protein